MARITGTSSYIYFETDIFPGLAITEENPGLYATAYGMLADFVRAVNVDSLTDCRRGVSTALQDRVWHLLPHSLGFQPGTKASEQRSSEHSSAASGVNICRPAVIRRSDIAVIKLDLPAHEPRPPPSTSPTSAPNSPRSPKPSTAIPPRSSTAPAERKFRSA